MDARRSELLAAGPMARRLRVPVRWIKAEADAGRLPCVKAERVYLFDTEAVESALIERARKAVPRAR